jgi:hypothetical protein
LLEFHLLEFQARQKCGPGRQCAGFTLILVVLLQSSQHTTFADSFMRRPKYYLNGKNIVSHFSWFSQDGTGATYNLSLVDPESGAMRPLGETYAQECGQMMASSIAV